MDNKRAPPYVERSKHCFAQLQACNHEVKPDDSDSVRVYNKKYLVNVSKKFDKNLIDIMRYVNHYIFAQLSTAGVNAHKQLLAKQEIT